MFYVVILFHIVFIFLPFLIPFLKQKKRNCSFIVKCMSYSYGVLVLICLFRVGVQFRVYTYPLALLVGYISYLTSVLILNRRISMVCFWPFRGGRISWRILLSSIKVATLEEVQWRGFLKIIALKNSVIILMFECIMFCLSHIYTNYRKLRIADFMDLFLFALVISIIFCITYDIGFCIIIHATRNILATALRNRESIYCSLEEKQ